MDEIGLYEEILQLDGPWFVEGIEFDKKAGMVTVNVACEEFERLRCPKCSRTSPRYDKRRRRWRHLDTCQFHTFVVADVPRVECVEHGCLTIEVGWAEQKSRFTRLFEGQVIEWLLEASTQAVGRQLNLSWNAVDGIMRRAVARGLLRRKRRRLTRISVDETSFRKRHDYVTIVTDERGIVIDVQDDAKKSKTLRMSDGRGSSPFVESVRAAIRVRHCSIRTEQAYVGWIRRFILFQGKRHPAEMGEMEVVEYLTYLAVKRQVSAATQNQALNALVFMYKAVVGRPLGELGDLVRAKRPVRLPVVLSVAEITRLLNELQGTQWLVACLLYGSGLRLLEALRLRVKDIDFD